MPAGGARLIVILGGLAAFGPLAIDMYLPAFPAMVRDLATEPAAVQRTLAAFFAGMGLGQLAYGPLADRLGRRPPLFLGLSLFALASAGAALAQEVGWLSWLRLAQGLGGCAGMVVARAVVRDLTEGPATIRMMSQLMLVMGIAPILAPSLGSALLAVAGWRAIFWALAAYGVALILAVALALPESLPPARRRRDGPLAVLGVYAGLLADRRFLGNALAGGLATAGMFAYIAASPFVFMDLHGLSPRGYGLLFGLNALGIMAVAQLNARLARWVPAERALVAVQAAMAGAAVLLLAAVLAGIAGFALTAGLVLVFVAGIGAASPLAAGLAMAPHGRAAGSASALLGALQFGLGALAGWLTGALQDGTALPMALVMALCAAAGLLARAALAR
jgi:DHA1 family bicyclomycin/chloramphenicol resistance-like MFS transporter